MRGLLLLAFCILPAIAQEALWVDASGSWRISSDDDPRYSQPTFDDGAWETVQLPWEKRPPSGVYWLRKTVELPAWADRSRLALTLGSIAESYELFLNGVRAGGAGGFSREEAQVARPRTFAIPAGASASHTLVIAVRIFRHLYEGSSTWFLYGDGPYVVTYREHASTGLGRLTVVDAQWHRLPTLLVASALGMLAIIVLTMWTTERSNQELLWFGLYLAAETGLLSSQVLLMSPDSFPWAARFRNTALFPVVLTLLSRYALAFAGRLSRWLEVLLWLILALWIARRSLRFPFAPEPLFEILSLAIIGFAWWQITQRRRSPVQHVLMALIVALQLSTASRAPQMGIGLPSHLLVGSYVIAQSLIWSAALSTLITGLLIRKLGQDRREKDRLASELEAARVIQQLLLKKPDLRERGWEFDPVYLPAQEVGGDFYCSVNGEVAVIGDVSGKGLKAAMVVSLLIGVLRETAGRSPAAVLASLNRAVAGQLEGGFVTCCCARLDRDGSVTLANAGHLPPYLDGVEVEMPASLPLGLDAAADFEEANLRLPAGSTLTFLSDGVVEAASSSGELFGFDRTRDISRQDAASIAAAARDWGQNDDITVITVRRLA